MQHSFAGQAWSAVKLCANYRLREQLYHNIVLSTFSGDATGKGWLSVDGGINSQGYRGTRETRRRESPRVTNSACHCRDRGRLDAPQAQVPGWYPTRPLLLNLVRASAHPFAVFF